MVLKIGHLHYCVKPPLDKYAKMRLYSLNHERGKLMTVHLTLDEYLDAFLTELQKRGLGRAARATFRKVANLYRNAGYSPKEASEIEVEETNQIWAGRAK
jgi:hypothetical protein